MRLFLLLATSLFVCGASADGRFVCYFPNWAIERQGKLSFRPNIY